MNDYCAGQSVPIDGFKSGGGLFPKISIYGVELCLSTEVKLGNKVAIDGDF